MGVATLNAGEILQRRNRNSETEIRFSGWVFGRRSAAIAACAVSLSACIATGTGLNLSSSQSPQAVPTPELAVLGDPNAPSGVVAAEDPGKAVVLSGIGVPVQAPRATTPQTKLASNTDTAPLAVVQENDASGASVAIANSTAGTPVETVAATSAGNETVPQENQEIAALDPPAQASIAGQADTADQGNKLGLLTRLFGGSASTQSAQPGLKRNSGTNIRDDYARSRTGRINDAHNTGRVRKPKANIVVATRSRDTESFNGDLPGVKSNAELFGIDQAEIEEELRANSTQLASVGGLGRISPNGLRIQHDKVQVACLKPSVIRLLKMVERRYGSKPIITSGYRSPKRNRRAGGARNSQHIFCKAVDIQVEGVSKWDLAKYLRTLPGRGGVGTYCRTKSVHVDVGSKRDWHHPCRRSKVKKRKKA